MVQFLDVHREAYGVEPICAVLPIAPSTYYEARARQRDPSRRLYKALGLWGIVRGRRGRTTVPEPLAHRPQDLVQRNFTTTRPNQLWVADLTYVATWRGFVYVAFVTDAFSRRIVGGRATTTRRTDLALDALEQALYDRELDGPR